MFASKVSLNRKIVLIVLFTICVFNASGEEIVKLNVKKISGVNTTSALKDGVLKTTYHKDKKWPKVAVNGKWDFSKYNELTVLIKNTGDKPFRIEWLILNPGGNWKKNSVSAKKTIPPRTEVLVVMKLVRKGEAKGKGPAGADLTNIVKMEFILPQAAYDRTIEIKDITPRGTYSEK